MTAVAACLSPPPQGMFTSEKSFLHVLNLLFRAFKVLELSASGSEEPELNSSYFQVCLVSFLSPMAGDKFSLLVSTTTRAFKVSTHLTQLSTCGRSFREHCELTLCSLTSQHSPTTHTTMHLFKIFATFMHNVGWSPSHSSLRALVIVLCNFILSCNQ